MKIIDEPDWESGFWLKRTIYVDAKIDIDNIGCHWTSDHGYLHMGGSDAGVTPTSRRRRELFVNAEKLNYIKPDNPDSVYESEVIISPGTKIECLIYDDEEDTFYQVEGNTGDRIDSWAKELF